MSNIQPFDYQKSTNIEEHNQIVNKVNEIVKVINDVNLDTINSEIAVLKTKATATDTEIANIKDKDLIQDTEIDGIDKSLISDVTASFDNPSRTLMISLGREASPSIDATVVIPASSETGQYSEGNGIKIQDYQISVDTTVVALKTDIPDVSGLTQRVQTLETEMPTKASVESVNSLEATVNSNTQNITTLTESVNGKVAIAQGTENAGKVLGIGVDGNVTPVNAGGSSGGGEVWEKVNLSNFPRDWVNGERIKIQFGNLNTTYNGIYTFQIFEIGVTLSVNNNISFPIAIYPDKSIYTLSQYGGYNTDSNDIFSIWKYEFGSTKSSHVLTINRTNISDYILNMWRLKN